MSSNLKLKIQTDLDSAMKSKDAVRLSTLRLLKAPIIKFEEGGREKGGGTDGDVLAITGKEMKQRRDSIDAFRKGGREDLAAKEEAEMKILQSYLPAQMSDDELRAVVKEVVATTGAVSKADFGKVMGAVMARVKGKADGQAVSRAVGEMLGG